MAQVTERRSGSTRSLALGAAAVLLAGVALLSAIASEGELGSGDAVVLGVVEGLTEYLPVSSTGHLTVTERLLGIGDTPEEKEAADAYAIVIQAGAILAVLLLYRRRVSRIVSGVTGRDETGARLAAALVAAFAPAALIGFLFEGFIKDQLFGVGPIVMAWFAGGVAILLLAPRLRGGSTDLIGLGLRHAVIIGLAQTLALWPGVSRSLVTILGGLAVGLTMAAAVEFSFLLGLVTLGAATAYEALASTDLLLEEFGLAPLLIGLLVSLLSAVVAVRWMVEYLNRHGLEIFGWYRIAVAAVGCLLLLTGTV